MKVKLFISAICIMLCISTFMYSVDKYTNPVIRPSDYGMTSTADPYIFKDSDGTYYCYVTGQGYPVFTSTDLVTWTHVANNPFPKKNCKWATTNFWAPEVVKVGNMYYLNYSAAGDDGIMKIGLAKSTSPLGPFQDISDVPFFDQGNKGSIDSHLFFDDDDRVYLYYSNAMSTNYIPELNKNRSEIWVIEVKPDLTGTIGEAKLLFYPTQSWEFKTSAQNYWNEGATMVKHNGTYYLMYSANCYCGSDYAVGYATSQSPTGPFVKYANNPILSNKNMTSLVSGPGHNGVVMSPDNTEMFCVYHTHVSITDGGGNRMLNIDRMGFTSDGVMYISGPTVTPQDYPSATPNDLKDPKKNNFKLNVSCDSAKGYIHMNIPLDSSKISIYNTCGSLFYSSPISENVSNLDVPIITLPLGMYIVQLESLNIPILTGKFVKGIM